MKISHESIKDPAEHRVHQNQHFKEGRAKIICLLRSVRGLLTGTKDPLSLNWFFFATIYSLPQRDFGNLLFHHKFRLPKSQNANWINYFLKTIIRSVSLLDRCFENQLLANTNNKLRNLEKQFFPSRTRYRLKKFSVDKQILQVILLCLQIKKCPIQNKKEIAIFVEIFISKENIQFSSGLLEAIERGKECRIILFLAQNRTCF